MKAITKKRSLCLYGKKSMCTQSLAMRGEKNPLESRKIKNSSYYYYILCRRHLNLFISSKGEMEGKKNNLLGSGKLHNKRKNNNLYYKQNTISLEGTVRSPVGLYTATLKTPTNKSGLNKTAKKTFKQISFQGVGITNFTKLLKNSKKHKIKNERNLMSGFFNKSYIKPGNVTSYSEFNRGGFFPYRKSFLCYWLLPFVGFVSSATLPLNPQLTQKSELYFPISYKTSDYKRKQKFEDSLIDSPESLIDTNDFIPEYVGYNPLNQIKNTLATDHPYFQIRNTENQIKPSFLLRKSNYVSAQARSEEKSKVFSSPVVYSEKVNNENTSFSSDNITARKLKTANNLGNGDLVLNPTSNSLKYCMLYLDCLENDLNFLEKENQVLKTEKNELRVYLNKHGGSGLAENQIHALPSEKQSTNTQKIGFSGSNNNPFSTLFVTDGFNKINFNSGFESWFFKEKSSDFSSPFYPTSFFNRVLLSNKTFDKFLSEPLKINFNVPYILSPPALGTIKKSKNYQGILLGGNGVDPFLGSTLKVGFPFKNKINFLPQTRPQVADIFQENKRKKLLDIVQEKMFSSNNVFSHAKTSDFSKISEENFIPFRRKKKFLKKINFSTENLLGDFRNLRLNNKHRETVLPHETTKLNKKNPVTSYLRASTLLDKYMVYKPILQDLETNIQFIKDLNVENKKNDLNQSINVKPELVDKLFSYFSKESIYEPSLDLSFSDQKSPQKVEVLKPLEGSSNLINSKEKIYSKKLENFRREGKKITLGNFLNFIKIPKIYNKVSKEKLYKIVLSTLKETLNKSHQLYETKNKTVTYTSGMQKSAGDVFNYNIPIKFKHPILMSKKSTYPLLFQTNESISSRKNRGIPEEFINSSGIKFENLRRNFSSEDFKNNYPFTPIKGGVLKGMLQKVSPVFKEKRPLENFRMKISLSSQNNIKKENIINGPTKISGEIFLSPDGPPIRVDNTSADNVLDVNHTLKTSDTVNTVKNKQQKLTNQYFILNTYLNKYTGYALKDFLILNKISTYIKPIPLGSSMKKTTGVGFSSKEDFTAKKTEKDLTGLERQHKNFPPPLKTDILTLDTNSISRNISIKDPYVLNNVTKENLLKTNLYSPNENFMLTKESSLRKRKIRQNNKTAKLLRAYFSIKKSSKKNIYGVVQKNTPKKIFRGNFLTSSNSLKQKIVYNLISKSYLQQSEKNRILSQKIFVRNNFYKPDRGDLKSLSLLKQKLKLTTVEFFNSSVGNLKSSRFLRTKEENGRKKIPLGNFLNFLKFLSNQFVRVSNQRRDLSLFTRGKSPQKQLMGFAQNPTENKDFSISPRLLINNRLFMKVNNKKNIKFNTKVAGMDPLKGDLKSSRFLKENKKNSLKEKQTGEVDMLSPYDLTTFNTNRVASEENKNVNEEVIRKRKTIQKKRRITKLKKETRRRKKRMRFYPRPMWLRYRFYSQFLKNRRHLDFKNCGVTLKKSERDFMQTKLSTTFSYSTGPSTIKVSPSIMGEFKTAFWKSYWLRSNLKPYLNKIKTSLNDIKKTPQFSTKVNSSFEKDFKEPSFKNLTEDFSTSLNKLLVQKPLSNKDIESYYKTANYLAEYNEISSQRIQQFVSQIRENLTLNGNAKVRPSRITMNFGPKGSKKNAINFLKRPSLRYNSMSRLRLYWAFSKGTTNLAGLGPNTLIPGAESVNGNNYNKRKQIWTTEKFRQQTKENKTKKLLNDMKTKLNFLLNAKNYISTESNIPLWNTLILKSLKKLRLQEEKLQNLAYVNTKNSKNNSIISFNRFPETKSTIEVKNSREGNLKLKTSRRPFNIRKHRLTNSVKQTAKVQPFISGKTNYWWTYSNNTPFTGVNSFVSIPVNYGTNLMQVYGPQDNIFNGQIKKGWASPSLKSTSSTMGMEWQLSSLHINTILFHFCSLITLLSISQIRGFLKFSFIGFNKVYSLLERLIPSNLYSNPLRSDGLIKNESNFGYNSNKDIKNMDFNLKGPPIRVDQTTEHQSLDKQKTENGYSGFYKEKHGVQKNNKESNSFFDEKPKKYGKILNGKKFQFLSPTLVEISDSTLIKNNQWVFDFEKQNNSFMYAFYVTNNNRKNIKKNKSINEGNQNTSYFNPRLTIDTQTKVIKDNHNLYIKPNVNNLLLSHEKKKFLLRVSLNKNGESGLFFPFLSLTGIYSLVNYLLKKPIFLYYKWFCLSPTGKSFKDTQMDSTKKDPSFKKEESWNRVTQMKNVSILYSLLFIRFGFNSYTQFSKNASNLLGQRTKLESAFRSVYTFFEKPGILIVDWVAYLFLVEWASDITNTLPEKIDTQLVGSPFNKLTRTIYNIYPFLPLSQYVMNPLTFRGVDNYDLANGVAIPGLSSKTTFLSLASTFLKRRIYHLYEILLLQFYQPDTDLLVRQKKGIVFWDIWGDFLTQTAEDSNINISELTSLKEEQIKLLENASQNISEESYPKNKQTSTMFFHEKKQRDKIYSKVSSVTPLKYLLNKKVNLHSSVLTRARLLENYKEFFSERFFLRKNLGFFLSKKGNKIFEGKKIFFPQNNKSDGPQAYTTRIIPSLKPITGNLGIPLTPFLGMPVSPRSHNMDDQLHQWGSQQFLSYAIKSKETELFIDLHPPRALASVLKNKESSQQLRAISPMGSLVCQIFAGILYKQISKNILIVGNVRSAEGSRTSAKQNKKKSDNSTSLNEASASMEKTLLVQAIAGETELKIITDNAYRYALVYRGVAVGIKLLRDVFDSLSLQTPCFFLIEDIHAIGERRPFLISDDTPEGGQNTEIHEKNQVLYQLSKHVISHYKKPYKGDFSLSIPTNHFCFDFFKGRNQSKFSIGKASIARQNTVSPKIRHTETLDGEQKAPRILPSRLLRPSTELLSPPATSPFSVLTLKEEKKFKTHKNVSDLPWTGRIMNTPQGETTSSQDSQKTGPAYSIRAKVALLADIAISSLSVKLDMITDLLVIIDSVKGNRGFVVFATTHIPFVLDPALRRPGRLDETISFGFSSKSLSWEVSHFSILNVPRPVFTPPSSGKNQTFFSPYTESHKMFSFMPGFNSYASIGRKVGGSLDLSLTSTGIDSNTILSRLCQKAIQTYPLTTTSSHTYLKRTSSLFHFFSENLFNPNSISNTKENFQSKSSNLTDKKDNIYQTSPTSFQSFSLSTENPYKYPQTTKILSQVATKASAYLNSSIKGYPTDSSYRAKEESNFDLSINNALTQLPDLSLDSILSNSSFLSMYASPQFFKNNVYLLISGKIGEFLLFSKKSQLERIDGLHNNISLLNSTSSEENVVPRSWGGTPANAPYNFFSTTRRSSLMPVITESISSLVLSFIQKRFLYKSNLMLPSLFNLTNYSSLLEPPSPPISSILLPAKRYENLKRSLSYYQSHDQNFGSGVMEKINLHQQQRLVKRLYNIPVKESFKSEIIENRLSSFANASLMIGSMSPSGLQKISSSNWFIRNRIFTRHSHYLTNQWWTGQLPEHNAETTFLSDIDWRYTFVEREARDILLDFPDTDQHYNPRNRRWVGNYQTVGNSLGFNSNSMSSLTSSANSFYSEVYSHFIYDSFLKAFNIYEQNREVFDYYAFHICKQGLHCHLHEFERLKLIQRFLQVEDN